MSETDQMRVIKRDGIYEPVQFDKVLERIRKAATGLSVNYTRLAQLVLGEIHDGVRTSELDELAARLAVSFMTTHPDWATLAARIIISNCQRSAPTAFSKAMSSLMLADNVAAFIRENAAALDAMVIPENDFLLDYFGFKTLEKAYLMRSADRHIVETPQYMWLRVATGIWASDNPEALARVRETYELMSTKAFTHATPTLFNSGTPRSQLSSCFVAGTPVHTMSGVKLIESVEIGDEVVTHTGAIKRVVQLHENAIDGRTLYDIKVAGTPTITVTENHRLMSLSAEQEEWGLSPTWNSVGYLRKGDWIAIPNKVAGQDFILDIKTVLNKITGDGDNIFYSYKYDDTTVYPTYNYKLNKKNAGPVDCTKNGAPFNRFWRFDAQAMELMGIWYGDGSVTNAKNSSGNAVPKNINVVAYHENTDLIEFVESALKRLLGDIHVTISKDKYGMVGIYVNHTIIAHAFKEIFKCRFDGKRIPAFFNTLGHDHVKAFLTGLTSSDGCVSSNGATTIQLTNPPLVQDIFHLSRSVGIPMTMTLMHSGSKKPTGRMSIPYDLIKESVKKHYEDDRLTKNSTNKKTWTSVRTINGTTYMRLNGKVVSEQTPAFVYTLGVEDDHSYSVGGIIAENCFLQAMKSDSLEGIFDTLKDCAQISKYAGGIGLHVHNIRAAGSRIAGTNGISDGLVPMLRVFNNTARYINQGGRRNGSFAIYLEPWHADIQAFLKMKSNTGSEEERARDLFYGLWVPDLFMQRVESGGDWSLFCPHEAPGLADVVGDAFTALYSRYEAEGRAKRTIPAQKLWSEILVSQIETGTPYLLYKDAANLKSNQKNLGTIKSSNLCVAPETLLHDYDPTTGAFRLMQIRDLADTEITIWNGTAYSKVTPRLTAENARLICVTVRQNTYYHDGHIVTVESELWCTPEHKFILNSHLPVSEAPRVTAQELAPGTKLFSWTDPYGCLIHQTVLIVSGERISDTYCFTEEQNHAGVFNGILTGQCTEIIEYSSAEETAVCNLASIALPYFLENKQFNFDKLRQVVAVIVRNLNRVIDINFYPTPETERSNMRHRPIGIGVQGLADVFAILGIAWETPEAATLNQEIFEHIYYASLETSNVLARQQGIYTTFVGSPASDGILQPDLWNLDAAAYKTASLDWAGLRTRIRQTGLRNSLLVAPMPTASTSQILGYNECIEPFTTNIYVRRTLAGEFTVINRYLVADLMSLNLWTPELKERIVAANGSVQGLPEIPANIKALYKTVWEMKQKTLIDMAADRGAFICQSQSLNLFVQEPTIAKLSSMHFYAWKRGLKTGIYYLRTKSAVQAIKFTVDASASQAPAPVPNPAQEPAECLLCSS